MKLLNDCYLRLSGALLSSVLLLSVTGVAAANNTEKPAVISIIIDDLGYRYKDGKAAINLPGPIAYAILPHAPHTKAFAQLAHASGKEVMLHMPMQAESSQLKEECELTTQMPHTEFINTFRQGIADVPHLIGVNNHQGSLLTRDLAGMSWVMEEMKRNDQLFFVDSRTTHRSVATKVARDFQVPVIGRDVFLDHQQDAASIEKQYHYLIKLALQKGQAVAIGHPYPETIAVLKKMLPKLNASGVTLVPISEQMSY